MKVFVEFEGYDAESYGVSNGTVTEISRTPRQSVNGNLFTAQLSITDSKYKIIYGMSGTASILVSNESVLQRVIQRIAKSM